MSSKTLTLTPKTALNQQIDLPKFPHFVFLKPHHQTALRDATAGNRLYSDYNFVSLWSWDHQNRLKISTLNGNVVIRFQDYTNPGQYFYSFFGTNKVDETAKTLLGYSIKEGIGELKLIPQFVVEKLQSPERFLIEEDRDSFDYIMAISDMAELPGGHNASKRRNLHKFHQAYGHRCVVRELDLREDSVKDQILAVARRWGQQTGKQATYDSNERRAIRKVVRNAHKMGLTSLHVVGLYVDDGLRAFSINEVLGDGFALGHYKKADRRFANIGVALDTYTAQSLRSKGVTHLNHEQDLGIEGLRQAKLASHPVYFLKKYKLSLA